MIIYRAKSTGFFYPRYLDKLLAWCFTLKSILLSLKNYLIFFFQGDRFEMIIFRIEPYGNCDDAPDFFNLCCFSVLGISLSLKFMKTM